MKKYNTVVVLLLVVAVMMVLVIKNKQSSEPSPDYLNIKSGSVVATMTMPKLLELGSVTCVPCKMMAPILDEIERTYAGQIAVEFIDVAKNSDAGEEYNIRIIPTQIFFASNGKELFRHEGFFSKEDIVAKWKELGFEFIETKQVVE